MGWNVPLPSPRNTPTVLSFLLVTTMSGMPSPVRSATLTS